MLLQAAIGAGGYRVELAPEREEGLLEAPQRLPDLPVHRNARVVRLDGDQHGELADPRLIRRIGETRARELLLGGNLIRAEKAETYGLINFVKGTKQIEKDVYDFAQMLIDQNSGSSMEMTKSLIGRAQDVPLEEALNLAAEMNASARETEDCKKGIQAFLDKTKIAW